MTGCYNDEDLWNIGDFVSVVIPDDAMEFTEITTQIDRKIAGKHDIYFIFSGKGFELESWYFN